MNEDLDAYGPQAAALLKLTHGYFASLGEYCIAAFYEGLTRHAGPDGVITRLNPEQFAHTQAQQLGQLRALLDPHLNEQAHHEHAIQAGHIHAFTGIETTWLVDAYELYLKQLLRHIQKWPGTSEERAQLRQVLMTRLMADLNGQIRGQHQIAQAQQQATSLITHLPETTTTFSDFIRRVLETLVTLPGMKAGTLARPDGNGDFQYETVAGLTFESHVTSLADLQLIPSIHSDRPLGQGPSGRAWRSAQIQQTLAIASDPTLAPWREFARDLGYASMATIPINDAGGCPQALVTLYHGWPGYFATPNLANLIDRLYSELAIVFARSGRTSHVVPYEIRETYRERLIKGALTMLYQPLIDLGSGQLSKVEALARLNNPDSTYVSPGDFLPAFGEHELRRLFAMGLRQALTDLRYWEDHGLATSVAINLPAQALADREYLAIARDVLHDIPIETKRLTLELLETAEIDSRRDSGAMLSEWKALGICLAQDDLGSGYSSLIRMEQLAVDDVKIDQGLVSTAVLTPHKALQFIHHLTHLAHSMDVRVTVEGLEGAGLIEAAAILGADAGQGYAIARPMGARELLSWTHSSKLPLDPTHPQTALGAYAAMIAQNALIALASTRPGLLKSVVSEPCALSNYLDLRGLSDTPIGTAVTELLACAHDGTRTAWYYKARQRVEDLLCAHIRAEGLAGRPST
ncbi:MAG TPA: EAL domain-containing protein [Acidiferrobacter sp.]|nr:EAL domain-containing protein [Acidiferrobacter sp.]